MSSPLKLDTKALARLAEVHGTPFYFYDMDAALSQVRNLRASLPPCVELLYCAKANSNRAVLEAFCSELPGLDVSSAGEVLLAEQAGYAPRKMSFAGPGKSRDELAKAIGRGLGILSIESLGEIERAQKAAQTLGRTQRVTLRINPSETPRGFAMRMGGQPSQFGVPEEDAACAVEAIDRADNLVLVGFHVYAGTQCLELGALVDNVRGSLEIARRLCERFAVRPLVMNLGGGFGIPYFAGQQPLDTRALTDALTSTLLDWRNTHERFQDTKFVFELGRFLIGPFGAYITRVIETKDVRGKRYVVLDGGMHHCFPATGNFGQLIKKNYPVVNLSRTAQDAGVAKQELCGPLCTPMDTMARGLELPTAEPGDLIAFLACGAYAFSASPLLFLGHDTPVELVKREGTTTVARPRLAAGHFAPSGV